MRKLFKKTMALILTSAMAITGAVSIAPGAVKTAKAVTTYNAYSSFQIWNTFAARDICVEPKQGLNEGKDYTVRNVGKTGNHVTYNYLKQYLIFNGDAKQYVVDGGFKDAKIDKDGTYTLEINNLDAELLPYINAKKGDKAKDGTAFDEDTKWSMLAISTDIPTSQKKVTCTNVKVYFDNETTPFATLAKAPYNTDEGDASVSGKNGHAYAFYIFDTYYENHGTKGVLDNTKAQYIRFPKKSMRIEFTISGINYSGGKVAVENGLMQGQTFVSGD